jgi:lysocardiolipin and lysophospholipid acyltransferase
MVGQGQGGANDRYGLGSVFFRSVPPPTVHMHLHLYSDLTSKNSPVPALLTTEADVDGLASPEDTRAFELWLRGVWMAKEKRLESFSRSGKFVSGEGDEGAREVIPIRQL